MALKALFRVRLLGFKGVLTGANRSSKKLSKGKLLAFALLMLYTFGYFTVMMYGMFHSLAGPFSALGLGVIYFGLAAVMCFSLMFVGTIFSAKAQLYEATDNDLLLSMPIRPGDILLSRMLLLLALNWIFGLIVAAPALIAWFQELGPQIGMLLPCLLVFVVLLPLLSLMLSAFFGWLLHLASGRVRNQSLLTVVLSLILLGGYFFVISRANIWLTELMRDPTPLANALSGVAPLVWLGRACAEGDLLSLGALTLITAGAVLLGWVLLSRSFIKTATDKRGAAKIKYVEKAVDAVPPGRALLRRELKHLVSSPSYILNGAMGVILAPAAGVVLLLRGGAFLSAMADPTLGILLRGVLPVGLCFFGMMSYLSASGISLEGKSLWVLQSLPVSPRQVLGAKLRLHLLVSLPPLLIASALFVIALRPGLLSGLMCVLLPAACALLSGLLGLFENLRHPNFDWTNETQAVKTGMSVLFTMLIGFGLLIPPMLAVFVLAPEVPAALIQLIFLTVVLLLCLLLWRWLRTKGEERFRAL